MQSTEHNLASWFVSRTLRDLVKTNYVRAVLSYADNDHHTGTVYRACNFGYYGLSEQKNDYWVLQDDGSYKKLSRGKTTGVAGEWRPRSRKHRYVITYDHTLKIRWRKPRNKSKRV